MNKLYVIAGPTASGKTAAAVRLAKEINGEVISADSMQVYKHMDIGTAKPTQAEMDGVPHHLLDVVLPDQPFSVAKYAQLTDMAIQDIFRRGKTPILAGGTGFYIRAVVNGTEFEDFNNCQHENDNLLREEYVKLALDQGADFLYKKLQLADPEYAKTVHPNNIKKVARALSFCETTGGLFSAHNASQKQSAAKYDTVYNIISMPREELYNRINARVIAMWDAGLPTEVSNLLSQGYSPQLTSMQGIGYKETVRFINGEQTKEETIAQIQQATRNYAKRQDTWFRHQMIMGSYDETN